MRHLKTFGAGLLLVSLGGCQSLAAMALKSFDQKPCSLPVAAEQLELAAHPVDAPASEPPSAEIAAPETSPARAAPAESTAVAKAAPPEPARTDIRGQGDGAMTDDRIGLKLALYVPCDAWSA